MFANQIYKQQLSFMDLWNRNKLQNLTFGPIKIARPKHGYKVIGKALTMEKILAGNLIAEIQSIIEAKIEFHKWTNSKLIAETRNFGLSGFTRKMQTHGNVKRKMLPQIEGYRLAMDWLMDSIKLVVMSKSEFEYYGSSKQKTSIAIFSRWRLTCVNWTLQCINGKSFYQ